MPSVPTLIATAEIEEYASRAPHLDFSFALAQAMEDDTRPRNEDPVIFRSACQKTLD